MHSPGAKAIERLRRLSRASCNSEAPSSPVAQAGAHPGIPFALEYNDSSASAGAQSAAAPAAPATGASPGGAAKLSKSFDTAVNLATAVVGFRQARRGSGLSDGGLRRQGSMLQQEVGLRRQGSFKEGGSPLKRTGSMLMGKQDAATPLSLAQGLGSSGATWKQHDRGLSADEQREMFDRVGAILEHVERQKGAVAALQEGQARLARRLDDVAARVDDGHDDEHLSLPHRRRQSVGVPKARPGRRQSEHLQVQVGIGGPARRRPKQADAEKEKEKEKEREKEADKKPTDEEKPNTPTCEKSAPMPTGWADVDLAGVEASGFCISIPSAPVQAVPAYEVPKSPTDEVLCEGAPDDSAQGMVYPDAAPGQHGLLRRLASGKSLLLPDDVAGTLLDVAYLAISVYECVIVGVHFASHQWDMEPRDWELAMASVSSFVCFVFALSRMRMARLRGWELIDEDAGRVWALYKKDDFIVDVLTVPPLDLALAPVSNRAYRILQCLRIVRMARLRLLFQTSNPLCPTRQIKSLTSVALFFIGHHVIACGFVLLNHSSPEDLGISGEVRDEGFWGAFELWMVGMYWAVQTTTSVGYGDVAVLRITHWALRWYTIFVMAGGVLLVTYFIGFVSARISTNDAIQASLRDKKQKMHSLMTYYKIPWAVQKEAFYLYPSLLEASAVDYVEVLGVLPPFMQEKIGIYVRAKLVQAVPMFSAAEPECLAILSSLLEETIVPPNEYVLCKGDIGNEMYFLAHGVVEVLAEDPETGREKQVVILRDGSWFGEIALLCETTRTASVRSVTACDLFCLSKEDFEGMLVCYPNSKFSRAISEEVVNRLGASMPEQLPAEAPKPRKSIVSLMQGEEHRISLGTSGSTPTIPKLSFGLSVGGASARLSVSGVASSRPDEGPQQDIPGLVIAAASPRGAKDKADSSDGNRDRKEGC